MFTAINYQFTTINKYLIVQPQFIIYSSEHHYPFINNDLLTHNTVLFSIVCSQHHFPFINLSIRINDLFVHNTIIHSLTTIHSSHVHYDLFTTIANSATYPFLHNCPVHNHHQLSSLYIRLRPVCSPITPTYPFVNDLLLFA